MKSRIVQPAPSFQPPETCTEHKECQAAQTPIADLKRNALDHYEKISAAAHEWHSVIPRAIAAYFDGQMEANDAATAMRDKCVEKVKEVQRNCEQTPATSEDYEYDQAVAWRLAGIVNELQSLTLHQVKPGDKLMESRDRSGV